MSELQNRRLRRELLLLCGNTKKQSRVELQTAPIIFWSIGKKERKFARGTRGYRTLETSFPRMVSTQGFGASRRMHLTCVRDYFYKATYRKNAF